MKALIDRIAPTDVRTLISGESGAGKGLCARVLHEQSGRKGQFVQVNCAAMPESLVESELYGHEKGAFSSTVSTHDGLIAAAHNGTLFLDEVTELPRPTQPKLLAVLDHGEFRRVGSTRLERSNFRLITATNDDIDARVELGEFRRDLRYRIGVARIPMPPLRERPEDIPLIAVHLFRIYANGNNGGPTEITRAALNYLSELEWKGNVRELQESIQLALAYGRDARIAGPGASGGARERRDPVGVLRRRTRKDAGQARGVSLELAQTIRAHR